MNYQSGQKEMVLSKEMERRLPYTLLVSSKIIESFESTTSPNNPSFYTDNSYISKNVKNIQDIQTKYSEAQSKLLKNSMDISNNIDVYFSKTNVLQKNNEKYHYNDRQDPNVILHPQESKDITAAILNDVNEIKLYQNSIYITTSIVIATLFISAILLSKK
jgi:hypothetical protein